MMLEPDRGNFGKRWKRVQRKSASIANQSVIFIVCLDLDGGCAAMSRHRFIFRK